MSSRDTLSSIGAGLGSALLFLIVLTGNPLALLLSYFGHLPLFLLGLWRGPKSLLVAATAACGALVLLGGPLPFTIYLVVTALPAMLLTRVALTVRISGSGKPEYIRPGIIVSTMALMIAIMMLVILAAISAEGLDIQGYLAKFLSMMYSEMGVDTSRPEIQNIITMFQTYFPAIVALSWFLMVLANAILAQAILARAGKNLRPTPSMASFELPGWSMFVFAVAAASVFFTHGSVAFAARNIAVILAVPFLLQGLALVHGQAARWPQRRMILTVFYIVAVLSSWSFVAITGLGIIEHLIRLRENQPMTRSNEEDR
jgi:hypothetical protein